MLGNIFSAHIIYRGLNMKTLKLLPFLLLVSCVTFKPQFANFRTSKPQQVIDSISNSNGVRLYNFTSWDKNLFVGSDSVITTQYTIYQKIDKRVLIISVIKSDADSTFNIKYRKE